MKQETSRGGQVLEGGKTMDTMIAEAATDKQHDVLASQTSTEPLMASYLTHELRAPLTSVRLGLELVLEQTEGRLQPDEKQILSLAIRNSNRLQRLIDDVMDYSKVMAGKMDLKAEACDPRLLIQEAVASLAAWAATKSLTVRWEAKGALPQVSADAGRVIQVLTNLLSNAIKFTPARGEIVLSIEAGRGIDSGKVIFRVKDSGHGIAPEDLASVFDAFRQAYLEGKRHDGTGLGLTLAKQMVELHGGRIWAESRVGHGAAFSFTIPAVKGSVVAEASRAQKIFSFLSQLSRKFAVMIAAVL